MSDQDITDLLQIIGHLVIGAEIGFSQSPTADVCTADIPARLFMDDLEVQIHRDDIRSFLTIKARRKPLVVSGHVVGDTPALSTPTIEGDN